jgi:hypothetical protein
LALFNKVETRKGSNKVSASAHPESTDKSSATKTISTTSSGFDVQAYKNGILDPSSSKPPENLEDIRKRYAQSRRTAPPTESAYGHYFDSVDGVGNEATMAVEMSGRLLKVYDEKGYTRAFNRAFTGFPKNVGFNNSLSAPQPDFVEGPQMQEFHPIPTECLGTVCFRVGTILSHTFSHSYGYVCSFIYYLIQSH